MPSWASGPNSRMGAFMPCAFRVVARDGIAAKEERCAIHDVAKIRTEVVRGQAHRLIADCVQRSAFEVAVFGDAGNRVRANARHAGFVPGLCKFRGCELVVLPKRSLGDLELGKVPRQKLAEPCPSLPGQSVISASGKCFCRRHSAPGVWPMSPMLTLCQELRRRMRGGWSGFAAPKGR
jgi:hypothetical protein